MAYLICAEDFDGPLNMALDEVLWRKASSGASFLRLYAWSDRPALSLGYFQDSQDVRRDLRLRELPYVRRLTGGGSIVHDEEMTYSLALPTPLAPRTSVFYERVHTAIASCLGELGVPAVVGAGTGAGTPHTHLCFSRLDRYAVCLHGVKILGSAQRRRDESVLMHGSLIVGRSAAAPGVFGLRDLLDAVPGMPDLRSAMSRAMQQALGLEFSPLELPTALRQQAAQLALHKYRTARWNDDRQESPAAKV